MEGRLVVQVALAVRLLGDWHRREAQAPVSVEEQGGLQPPAPAGGAGRTVKGEQAALCWGSGRDSCGVPGA